MKALLTLSALLLLVAPPAPGQDFVTSSTCDAQGITISFTYDDQGEQPEAVGYDIRRLRADDCTSVVITKIPLPRVLGETHGHDVLDDSAETGVRYRYEVVWVDSNRDPVTPSFLACNVCMREVLPACPEGSAPVTFGTISEFLPDVFLEVTPCARLCYAPLMIEAPWPEALDPYIGTDETIEFFGTVGCGTVEGCLASVDSFELTPCALTPMLPTSWGRVKARYEVR